MRRNEGCSRSTMPLKRGASARRSGADRETRGFRIGNRSNPDPLGINDKSAGRSRFGALCVPPCVLAAQVARQEARSREIQFSEEFSYSLQLTQSSRSVVHCRADCRPSLLSCQRGLGLSEHPEHSRKRRRHSTYPRGHTCTARPPLGSPGRRDWPARVFAHGQ